MIHTLPALTDAARAIPGISFDWVVEEDLAPIPRSASAVDRVLPVAYRQWRFRPLQGIFGGALAQFRARLRERRYDAVIDAQGLYKSGVITWLADGPKHGYDLAVGARSWRRWPTRTAITLRAAATRSSARGRSSPRC